VSLTDKRILVVGGGSGIGFAVAEAAAAACTTALRLW